MRLRLLTSEKYWRLRRYTDLAWFYAGRFLFFRSHALKKTLDSASVLAGLSRRVAGSVFVVIAVLWLLEGVEDWFLSLQLAPGLSFLRVIQDPLARLSQNLLLSRNSVQQFYGTTASLLAVFLGLYFTAIQVIGSAAFARVPGSLRQLFLSDKGGRLYLRTLAFTAVLALFLLLYSLTGSPPGVLSTGALGISAALCVLSFLLLGIRTFSFLDPSSIAPTLFFELAGNLRNLTAERWYWDKPSYQRSFTDQARSDLEALGTLIRLCVKESHLESKPLQELVANVYRFLGQYAHHRSLIHPSSTWYKQLPIYKNWYICDGSALILALQSNTSISPSSEPDHHWLDVEMGATVVTALSQSLSAASISRSYLHVRSSHGWLEELSGSLEAGLARRMADLADTLMESKVLELQCEAQDAKYEQAALFDALRMSHLAVITGLAKHISRFEWLALVQKCDRCNWASPRRVIREVFEPPIVSHVFWIVERISMEIDCHSRRVTPDWYITQLMVKKYIQVFAASADEIVKDLEGYFVGGADSLISQQRFEFAAMHINRGLEGCSKSLNCLSKLKTVSDAAADFRRDKDMPWPESSWDDKIEAVTRARDALTTRLFTCLPELAKLPQSNRFPDILGQAMTVVLEGIYLSLAAGEYTKYTPMLQLLPSATVAVVGRLGSQVQNWLPESAIAIAAEPWVELLEVSGYILLEAELRSDQSLAQAIIKAWDSYLDGVPDKKATISFLIGLYDLRHRGIPMNPRSLLRTHWEADFENRITNAPFQEERVSRYAFPETGKECTHPSPLIRAICFGGDMIATAGQVFIAEYLMARPEAEGIARHDPYDVRSRIRDERSREARDQENGRDEAQGE